MHKKGIATGVFDLFHKGHKGFLDFCRERCERLEVRLHEDDFAESHGQCRPILDFTTRRMALLAYGVDEVVPVSNWNDAFRRKEKEILFIGDSQKEMTESMGGRELVPRNGPSTSELKRGLKLFPSDPDNLGRVVSTLESNGVEHCIMFGTLLGAMRNGKKVPWDKDYDVLVFDRDMDETKKLFSGVRVRKHEHYLSVMSDTRVDIFFLNEMGGVNHLGQRRLPFDGVRPFDRISIDGVEVNAPRNRKDILDAHYPGWECNFSVWKSYLPSKFDVNF